MLYKRLIINGVEFPLAVNRSGKGKPYTSTEGAIGGLYMDTDTGQYYKCTAAEDDVYTWEEFTYGGFDPCGNAGNYPDWSHLKWYVMGDSLTAQDNDFTDKRYYDFVQEKTDIQVIVDGIGATGYKTGENEGKSYLDRVKNIPEDVDIVTIFGSGNDLKSDDTEYANTAIWETLRWLVLNRPGLRVVVVPPAPWRNFDKRGEVWKAYCDRLQTCALACDFRYVSDMYDCPPFNGKHDSHMEKFFTTDPNGVHPNELGHEALAPFFYNALSQELALKAVGGNADLNELINNALAAIPNAAEVAY